MMTSTSQTKDLWAIAVGKVGDDDKAQLDVYRTEKIAVLNDVLSLVRAKQATCVQKGWKFKKNSGESSVVRDLSTKLLFGLANSSMSAKSQSSMIRLIRHFRGPLSGFCSKSRSMMPKRLVA